MFFRFIGWLCVAALVIGVGILALDSVGIRFAGITGVAVLLALGGFVVSGVFAMIEVFFFSDRPRREKWLEYYRQQVLPSGRSKT